MSGVAAVARRVPTLSAPVVGGLAIGLGILALVVAQVSAAAFLVAGTGLLLLLGLASLRWPRAVLVVVVLSPALVDLYAGQRLLPEALQPVARFFSEALLVALTVTLALVAARRGRLLAALRHPFTLALLVFVGICLVSAVANEVPPTVAAAGLMFTLDATILFFLPRMVGYSHAEARQAIWAIAGVVALTSTLAVGQAILSPDLLGVTPVTGLSGEGVRFASLVRDPNILGTLIGIATPFTLFTLVRLRRSRRRWITAGMAFALALALLLTYSRGSWLGVAVGFGFVAIVIDRRALLAFVVAVALAYATAVVMPKGILAGGSVGYDPFATTVNRFSAVGEGRDLRTLFVRNALPIVDDHLLLGVGPGRYGGAAAAIFGSPVHTLYGTDLLLTNQQTVDNFWLHVGVEGGVLGVTAFLAMVGTALITPFRALRGASGSWFSVPAGVFSASAVVCVATVTTMLLEGNTAAFLFWFLLGIGSMAQLAEARTGDPTGTARPSAG